MHADRLTTLYREYGPTIFARCRGLLKDEREAEDATQETFLRVYRRLDRVPNAREALFWIYRVATNYCLNELRNRRHRALPWPTTVLPSPVPDFEAPEGRLLDRDLVRRLAERAPVKVLAVAWLHYIDGFDQHEVAAILGISRRTVAERLSLFTKNARKYLRRSNS